MLYCGLHPESEENAPFFKIHPRDEMLEWGKKWAYSLLMSYVAVLSQQCDSADGMFRLCRNSTFIIDLQPDSQFITKYFTQTFKQTDRINGTKEGNSQYERDLKLDFNLHIFWHWDALSGGAQIYSEKLNEKLKSKMMNVFNICRITNWDEWDFAELFENQKNPRCFNFRTVIVEEEVRKLSIL